MDNILNTRAFDLDAPQPVTPGESTKKNIPLRISELRKSRRMSQRELARKLNCPRTYLQRLEGRIWNELSLGEFAAISEVFKISISEMLRWIVPAAGRISLERCSLKSPRMVNRHEGGCQMSVLSPADSAYFLGALTLPSGKSFAGEWLPYKGPLSGIVTQGAVLITSEMEEIYFRKNECFNFSKFPCIEISNTHGFKEASVLIVSLPSDKSV